MANTIDGLINVGSLTIGTITIDPGDFRIGAVEVQDDDTGERANVERGGLEVFERTADTISAQTSVAMGGAAASLVAANKHRQSVVFTNTSTTLGEVVYLGGTGITVGQGIPLWPGETYEDTKTGTQWFGIASSGTPSVAVYETERVNHWDVP